MASIHPAGLILGIICIYFTIRFALQPQRSIWGRIIPIVLLALGFFIPWGWILILTVGGICWADARAGN